MSQAPHRVPPQNIEAEEAVIGSMLIEQSAVIMALEMLSPDDFYKENHRIIFKAMAEIANRMEPVDLVTVSDACGHKDLERIEAPPNWPGLLISCPRRQTLSIMR